MTCRTPSRVLTEASPSNMKTKPLKKSRSRSDKRGSLPVAKNFAVIKEEEDSFSLEQEEQPRSSIKGLVEKYVKRELSGFKPAETPAPSLNRFKKLVEENLGKQEVLEYQVRGKFLF